MFNKRVLIALLVLVLSLTMLSAVATEEEKAVPIVVINEIAWAGTPASGYDEWIELKNNTDQEIDLTGWTLSWNEDTDNPRRIEFPEPKEGEEARVIPPQGFYLLERTNDDTITDIEADLIYTGGLDNQGESLILKNPEGEVIDTANADGGEWPAGTASNGEPAYASMERIDPMTPDADDNWATNNGKDRNGKDAEGFPINGTPKEGNSVVASE